MEAAAQQSYAELDGVLAAMDRFSSRFVTPRTDARVAVTLRKIVTVRARDRARLATVRFAYARILWQAPRQHDR